MNSAVSAAVALSTQPPGEVQCPRGGSFRPVRVPIPNPNGLAEQVPFQACSPVLPTEAETEPQHGSSRPPRPAERNGHQSQAQPRNNSAFPNSHLQAKRGAPGRPRRRPWRRSRSRRRSRRRPRRRSRRRKPAGTSTWAQRGPRRRRSHPSALRVPQGGPEPTTQCSPFPAGSRGEEAPTQSRRGADLRPARESVAPTLCPRSRPVLVRKQKRNCRSTFSLQGRRQTDLPERRQANPPPPEYQSCNLDTNNPCRRTPRNSRGTAPDLERKRLPRSGASVWARSHAPARRLRSRGRAVPRAARSDAQRTHTETPRARRRRGLPGPAAPTR